MKSLKLGTSMREIPLVAEQRMKEFDPAAERHYPLVIIKAVDPGCTMELQIEDAHMGTVTRITTTDNAEADRRAMRNAVLDAFEAAWGRRVALLTQPRCDRPGGRWHPGIRCSLPKGHSGNHLWVD